MADKSMQLSPRFGLALANLKTLRLAFKVFEDEGGTNIRQLLKYLENYLKTKIPDLGPWDSEIEDDELYIWPGKGWNVLGNDDDGIGMVFDFSNVRKAWSGANPWVGIYVPSSWSQSRNFKEQLRRELPKSVLDNWGGGASVQWPIWSHVDLVDYANEDEFDLNGLVRMIEQRAKELLDLRPLIDSLIKQLS